MYASLFSHNETVLYLLEMKADPNLKNPHGKTPLMLASVCGSEETIVLLLKVNFHDPIELLQMKCFFYIRFYSGHSMTSYLLF